MSTIGKEKSSYDLEKSISDIKIFISDKKSGGLWVRFPLKYTEKREAKVLRPGFPLFVYEGNLFLHEVQMRLQVPFSLFFANKVDNSEQLDFA